MPKLKNVLTAVAIAASALAAAPASADVTSEGVVYSASWADLTGGVWDLTLGIDASLNTFGAAFLQAAAIEPGGGWTGVTLISKTNGGTLGDTGVKDGPVSSGACKDKASSMFCVDGSADVTSPITLVFRMTGANPDLYPHLQVGWNVEGHQFSAAVVPEPEAYGLALAGMLVVGFAMRRKA